MSDRRKHLGDILDVFIEDVSDTLLFLLWRVRENARPTCRASLQHLLVNERFVRAECGNPASFHCQHGHCFGHCRAVCGCSGEGDGDGGDGDDAEPQVVFDEKTKKKTEKVWQ